MKFIIYTDGASRGNPGPAAIGAVLLKGSEVAKEYSVYIGEKTNNEAEYQAVIFALKKFKLVFGKKKAKKAKITLKTDSDLLVKHMNHKYKVKNENIIPLFLELWNLCLDFGEVKFEHIDRENNKRADELANLALDQKMSIKKLIE